MRARLMVFLPIIGMLAAALLALQPCTAFACSCIAPGAPDVERDRAAAVFAGRVVSIETVNRGGPAPQLQVRFDVSQSWKGPAASQIEIVTSESSASCGFTFTEGSEYLVYANDNEGYLNASLCSRTASLDAAGEDLDVLGAAGGELPVGVTGPVGDGQIRSDEPATPSVLPNVGLQSPALWLGAGAVVLAAGAVAAWLLVRRQET